MTDQEFALTIATPPDELRVRETITRIMDNGTERADLDLLREGVGLLRRINAITDGPESAPKPRNPRDVAAVMQDAQAVFNSINS